MKHPERMEDYLEHIVEAIDRAAGYLEPVASLEAFQENPQIAWFTRARGTFSGGHCARLTRGFLQCSPSRLMGQSGLNWRVTLVVAVRGQPRM